MCFGCSKEPNSDSFWVPTTYSLAEKYKYNFQLNTLIWMPAKEIDNTCNEITISNGPHR